ncbi:MAG TPA: F0F1 ATP synthase subunit B [Candidatus Dojkabacteria bacterium]|jgi:F-type H+-transporting ATPase subunit b
MDILEILGKIGFDWKMAVISVINFLVVLLIISKFIFAKIGESVEERQKIIQKGLEDADRVANELSMAEQKYNDIIKDAQKEANSIITDAEANAQTVAQDIKSKANDEAEEIKTKAQEQISKERSMMLDKLKRETADLAILATEKILKDKLDQKSDKALIEDYLNTIK